MRRGSWSGITAALAGLALAALGCATSSAEAGKPKKYEESRTETATAVVEAIDQATRKVTLRAQDGRSFTFVAGPEVRNLAQVQAGDLVKVQYTESLAVEVRKGDGSAPDAQVAAAAGRAEPGEKPAAAVAATTTITATVETIDTANSRVTLKGPAGNYRVVKVKDPAKLKGVSVGDLVVITYTESVGIAVEKVAKP
jgi:Cu/Ag efflux protein CusF